MEMEIIIIILGMAVVTYIPRYLPIMILTKFDLSPKIKTWLSYVPVAVLSALLFPGVLLSNQGNIDISWNNHFLMASIPCILVAIKFKSMVVTIITGMAAVFLLSQFI